MSWRKRVAFPWEKEGLPQGETIPRPGAADVMVFKDFFTCGLRFLAVWFLWEALEDFEVQLHHLTPNDILTISKFCWACESYGSVPNLETFYEHYELQR